MSISEQFIRFLEKESISASTSHALPLEVEYSPSFAFLYNICLSCTTLIVNALETVLKSNQKLTFKASDNKSTMRSSTVIPPSEHPSPDELRSLVDA